MRWRLRILSSPDSRVQLPMCIVAMGVVCGDIGTSPLYTMQAFIADQGGINAISRFQILGMLSLLFWSILLIVTTKYVLVATHISNKGEGGIFALFTMVKRYGKWLAIPAMIGGAALFADSVLTPAVSISSAVGGLGMLAASPLFDSESTLLITIVIIVLLFSIQSQGTVSLGRVFGAVIVTWFGFIATMGLYNIFHGDTSVFEALNPLLGVRFLFSGSNRVGVALMGTVFLAVTGGEAIYSDMGHVGCGSVYATWPFINVALVLCYFGQGAWMLRACGDKVWGIVPTINPFFEMMPVGTVRILAVLLSVVAGIIASQALITGAFSMVSEATTLNWMPHLQVRYSASTRGQLYIPTVNAVLCCLVIVTLLIFRTAERLSAAYGLALTVTMFMNTILLGTYLWFGAQKKVASLVFQALFLSIEGLFLVASCAKFTRGGWFTMLLTLGLLVIMYSWALGTKIERSQRRHFKPRDFLSAIDMLRHDETIPFYADNVVYLTSDLELRRLDADVFYSIFAGHTKRARAWWIVSVNVTDDPFTREYSVENFGTDYLFRVRMRLGFKVDQNVATYLRQIMRELIDAGQLPVQCNIYPKLNDDQEIGAVQYVIIHKELVPESKVTTNGATALRIKYAIRSAVGSSAKWFGLTAHNPIIETQPLFVATNVTAPLKRVNLRKSKHAVTLRAVMTEIAQEEQEVQEQTARMPVPAGKDNTPSSINTETAAVATSSAASDILAVRAANDGTNEAV
ncbi:MAG: KUP/HAK/KT family potassium transporter [Aeriscardovia sp.]|nr:KUP/HAK/KT family potassium transporter [Aeriscardovia sp.]